MKIPHRGGYSLPCRLERAVQSYTSNHATQRKYSVNIESMLCFVRILFAVYWLSNYNNHDMVLFTLTVSPCTADLCLNNGTCNVTSDGNANCTCDGDWTGNICDGKHSKNT